MFQFNIVARKIDFGPRSQSNKAQQNTLFLFIIFFLLYKINACIV